MAQTDDFLEGMLAHAAAQVAPKGKAKKATVDDFKDISQWRRKRCIALIHRESGTLLGNFAEFTHPKDTTARWLVKQQDGLQAVDGLEEVSGPEWVPFADPVSERLHRLEEEWETVLDLYLPEMRVKAAAVHVVVILSSIGIHRVELAGPTTFYGVDYRSAITLPGRLNVLGEMHREAKILLKEEMEGRDSERG